MLFGLGLGGSSQTGGTGLGVSPSVGANGLTNISNSDLEGLIVAVASLSARVENLEDLNKARASEGLNDATRLGGHTFTKQDDVEAFSIQNSPASNGVPQFGPFADPLLPTNWIWIRVTGSSVLKEDLVTPNKFVITDLELKVIESFGTDVLRIFVGKTDGLSIIAAGGPW